MPNDEKEILIQIREDVATIKAHFSDMKERVKKVEDNQTWLWKTVIGACIVTVIGIVLKFKGV